MAEEINGILQHEMTHMYQNDDKPEGTFSGLANMYEGIGDAVRIRNGHAPAGAQPDKNGRWQDKTYSGQAFFWLYIDNVLPRLHLQAQRQHEGPATACPGPPRRSRRSPASPPTSSGPTTSNASCCQGDNRSCCS